MPLLCECLFTYFQNLFQKQSDREKEREIESVTFTQYPYAHIAGLCQVESRRRNSIQLSHMHGRNVSTWIITQCFAGCSLTTRWIRSRRARTLSGHWAPSCEMQPFQSAGKPIHHNIQPKERKCLQLEDNLLRPLLQTVVGTSESLLERKICPCLSPCWFLLLDLKYEGCSSF